MKEVLQLQCIFRQEDRIIESRACYRPDGFEIDQITLKLETNLQVPSLRIINSLEEAYFCVNNMINYVKLELFTISLI